ncbi:MAG: HlyD family secretion protein [Prevotella sp.]|nr:HlyD family secretion protein [Prevotella sp.]
MDEVEKIELRSRKVRHIVGEVPPRIVRYGIIVITLVLAGLLAAVAFIPYPETITAEATALNGGHAEVHIPYKYVNTVSKGMTVHIEFEGYVADMYGYVNGLVTKKDRTVRNSPSGNTFTISVTIKGTYFVRKGMAGRATIFITNGSVLERILESIGV